LTFMGVGGLISEAGHFASPCLVSWWELRD